MRKKTSNRIGIVGGVGPLAGLDLARKIFNQTKADCDEKHLDLILASLPNEISDRTEYILGKTKVNPATGIIKVINILIQAQVSMIAIPCNTTHAPVIFDKIIRHCKRKRIQLVNMIEEVAHELHEKHPAVTRVGILGTLGAKKTKVYDLYLNKYQKKAIYPNHSFQVSKVHSAIYSKVYGIKAHGNPVSKQAKRELNEAIEHLREKGAEAIILGCTEIPLAITKNRVLGMPVIDSTRVLARALIKNVSSQLLKN